MDGALQPPSLLMGGEGTGITPGGCQKRGGGVPHSGCYAGHPGWSGNPNILAWVFHSRLSSVLGQGTFSKERVGWSQTPDSLCLVMDSITLGSSFSERGVEPHRLLLSFSFRSSPCQAFPEQPGVLSGTSRVCPDSAWLGQVVWRGVLSFISHSIR